MRAILKVMFVEGYLIYLAIFADINFREFNIEKYFAGIQFLENGPKPRNSRKNVPAKISTP